MSWAMRKASREMPLRKSLDGFGGGEGDGMDEAVETIPVLLPRSTKSWLIWSSSATSQMKVRSLPNSAANFLMRSSKRSVW